MRVMKNYEELTFTDDFMFCKILTKHQDLCKQLIEIILNVKIRKIEVELNQYPIELTYDGRGIRLDVYVEDDEGTVYDIEMQTTKKKDLPRRTRYYQGMIDLNLIERGASFSELKKSYIIFICTESPFESNLPIYTFKNVCQEDNAILLDDDAVKVIVNAEGETSRANPEVKALLDYITTQAVESDFTKKINNAVSEAIDHQEWRSEYMTLAMRLNEERLAGRDEGRLEGAHEKALQVYKNCIERGMDKDNALAIAGISEAELKDNE